jgi:hypothetical protein
MSTRIGPELCKRCAFYIERDKTCSRSVVATSKTTEHFDYAKSVRLDPKRCGLEGKLFQASPMLSKDEGTGPLGAGAGGGGIEQSVPAL